MTTGVYGEVHRQMLLMAGRHPDRHFRPDVAAAHLGLSITNGRAVAGDLIEIGFWERETIRHPGRGYVSFAAGTRNEGPDNRGRYTHVVDTPYCRLTEEGRAELRLIGQQADGLVTLHNFADEVARLRAEITRLMGEASVLGAEDVRLYDECRRLTDENQRLWQQFARLCRDAPYRDRRCPRCSTKANEAAKYCGRCGSAMERTQAGASARLSGPRM